MNSHLVDDGLGDVSAGFAEEIGTTHDRSRSVDQNVCK